VQVEGYGGRLQIIGRGSDWKENVRINIQNKLTNASLVILTGVDDRSSLLSSVERPFNAFNFDGNIIDINKTANHQHTLNHII